MENNSVRSPSLTARCNGCGNTIKRLMLMAMLSDAGARCSPSPTYCPGTKNHEHDFTVNEATRNAGLHRQEDAR